MSAESAAAARAQAPAVSARTARTLRYATGSALALTVAMAAGWPLAFLTPVLSLSFLGSPAPRPGLRAGAVFVLVVALACAAGGVLSGFLLSYPLVYVPFTALLLFRLIHAKTGGFPAAAATLMLITFLVLPLVALQSPTAVHLVAQGIVTSAAATLIVVWVAHAPFPDPERGGTASPAAKGAAPLSAYERFRFAAESTLIILPVFVLFYTLQMTSAVVILVFTAVLSQQPGFASSYKAGAALVLGNVAGGLASLVVYELLVVAPELPFLFLITLLAGLGFGARLFAGKPASPLFGMAYSTLLLVIGSTTAGGNDEAGSKVTTRVIQITIAVVYVVAASGTLHRLWPPRRAAA